MFNFKNNFTRVLTRSKSWSALSSKVARFVFFLGSPDSTLECVRLTSFALAQIFVPARPLLYSRFRISWTSGSSLSFHAACFGSLKFLQDKGRDRIVEGCGDFRVRPPFLEHRNNEVSNGHTKFEWLFRFERHARKSKIITSPLEALSGWFNLKNSLDT